VNYDMSSATAPSSTGRAWRRTRPTSYRRGRIATIGRIREHGGPKSTPRVMWSRPASSTPHAPRRQVFWDQLGTNSCWHGGHHCGHGHCASPRPCRAGGTRPRGAEPGAGRGHLGGCHGGRHRLDMDDLRRVSRRRRSPTQGDQLRRHLGHSPCATFVMASGPSRARPLKTSQGDGRGARRRPASGCFRLHDVAHRAPPDLRRPARGSDWVHGRK